MITSILNSLHFRSAAVAVFSSYATITAACCDTSLDQGTPSANVAEAADSAYNQLQNLGCDINDREATETCTGDIFNVFSIARALVQTNNEITGNDGPTEYSLGLDAAALNDALRWNAAEEFSSQESMTSRFTSGQLSTLSGRISALRSGTVNAATNTTDTIAGTPFYRNNTTGSGMNAGDSTWSQIGGFINGSVTYGNLGPTLNEDAFDFDGFTLNGGLDYRINNQWVVGGILGYVTQNVDFDSSLSTANGTIEMTGLSLTPFILYQAEKWYGSASLAYQDSDFTSERRIMITSFNINVPSINTLAVSNNNAAAITFNAATGYSFQVTNQITIEPSITLNHQRLTIDKFTEDDISNDGYNLTVFEQKIESLETSAAIKIQYVTSNTFGVFTPFIDIQSFAQHRTDSRNIKSVYASIADSVSDEAYFFLPTNGLDADYKSYGIGIASVLRGARQSKFGSAAAGGIQAFLSMRILEDSGEFKQKTFAGGIRYEF